MRDRQDVQQHIAGAHIADRDGQVRVECIVVVAAGDQLRNAGRAAGELEDRGVLGIDLRADGGEVIRRRARLAAVQFLDAGGCGRDRLVTEALHQVQP